MLSQHCSENWLPSQISKPFIMPSPQTAFSTLSFFTLSSTFGSSGISGEDSMPLTGLGSATSSFFPKTDRSSWLPQKIVSLSGRLQEQQQYINKLLLVTLIEPQLLSMTEQFFTFASLRIPSSDA